MNFKALSDFAKKHDYEFGFVRDKDSRLYINNTAYSEDMSVSRCMGVIGRCFINVFIC